MVEIINYHPRHLDELQLMSAQREDKPRYISTPAVTFKLDNRILAIFGAFYPTPGVAHLWGLVSDEAPKCAIPFIRAVRKYIDFMEKSEKLRRIQIDIREDYLAGIRWASALGFDLEARLNHYNSDGSNAMLYARTQLNGTGRKSKHN